MKKHWYAIVLAGLMAAALCACAQKEKETSAAETSAAETSAAPASASADKESSGNGEGTAVKPDKYPDGTVTWIVPSSAGGVTDTFSRAIIDNLDLGGNVVVENIPGGSQTVATAEFAAQPANGQTVIMMANAGLISQPIMTDVPYDISQFRMISELAPEAISMVAVKAGSKLQTADQFIDYIKNNQFSYGCANVGGYQHVAMCNSLLQLGCYDNGTIITYEGTQNVLQALLNGEIDFALLDDDYVTNHISNGELDVVLALYEGSSPLHPEVPGISEYGVTGMSSMVAIKFLAVHKDTPEETVQWIRQQVNKAVLSDGFQQFLKTSGYSAMTECPTEEEIMEKVNNAIEITRDVLTKAGYID